MPGPHPPSRQRRSSRAPTKRGLPRGEAHFDFGLSSRRETPRSFDTFHRHDEIELNVVEHGSISYHFGDHQVELAAGTLAVFWGAMPHCLVCEDDATVLHWLTLPLSWFLNARFPAAIHQRILAGEVLRECSPGRASSDFATFLQWHQDLQRPTQHQRTIVLLEAEARIRRLALSADLAAPGIPRRSALPAPSRSPHQAVEHMASYIARHYHEPLRMADIAAQVNLHPDYAAMLFRRTYRMGLQAYVLSHRLARAQRLLVVSDARMIDIALESGFGSASRFYAAFATGCGMTPHAYRRQVRQRGQESPSSS